MKESHEEGLPQETASADTESSQEKAAEVLEGMTTINKVISEAENRLEAVGILPGHTFQYDRHKLHDFTKLAREQQDKIIDTIEGIGTILHYRLRDPNPKLQLGNFIIDCGIFASELRRYRDVKYEYSELDPSSGASFYGAFNALRELLESFGLKEHRDST